MMKDMAGFIFIYGYPTHSNYNSIFILKGIKIENKQEAWFKASVTYKMLKTIEEAIFKTASY